MNQRLYAAAQRMKVDTHRPTVGSQLADRFLPIPRPDNDIAMDVLAKLNKAEGLNLHWHSGFGWDFTAKDGFGNYYTAGVGPSFIEAVVALEERSRSELAAD